MRMNLPPMSRLLGMIPVSSMCAAAVVLSLAACVEVDNLRDDGGLRTERETKRERERFRTTNVDHGRLVNARADVRKNTATHGWGVVDRDGDPLSRYLNGILKRIVAVSPFPDIPVRVVVVDMQRSPVALARRDGTIYIPLKLLVDMSAQAAVATEDALAFLLAHELSHILHYHFRTDAVGDTVEIVKAGAEVAYTVLKAFGDASGRSSRVASAMETVETFYGRVEIVQFLEESALSPAFTREQENEADLLAFDLMVEAGYNPDAAYDFMDLLVAYEDAAQARRKEARAESESKKVQDAQGDIASLLEQGIQTVISAGLASMKREHAMAGKRRAALNKYHDRWADDVAEAEDIDLRSLGWMEGAGSESLDDADAATIRRLFANYEAANKAEVAIAARHYDDASALIQESLSFPTEFNAYPRIVATLYHMERGQRSQAMEHVRLAFQGPGPSFDIYERFLGFLDDDVSRLEVLDEAEQAFGRFVRLMRLRATILDRLGREEEARRARSSCYSENILSKQRSECDKPLEI